MDESVRLSASDILGDRPFTHPDRTVDDLRAIHSMLSRLRGLVTEVPALPAEPRPLVVNWPDDSGRQHRVVICDDRRLRVEPALTLVGFFATKRLGLDDSPLTTTDDELILEFPLHPGILSYSSLEFPDGNWANLIVVHPPEAKDHWRTSEKHAYAVQELAPTYYAVVRLHNLRLPGGLRAGGDPILLRTKYYDFQGAEPWRAERELATP
ncbi:MAG: hypothetical protein ACRELA_23900 [Candidatus Rokuibacteriota bacterium]